MILHSPFFIGSRLLPCLAIGGATISLDYSGQRCGRMTWRWFIDLADGSEFSEVDLSCGANGATDQQMFATLLSFLGACGEGLRYQERTGRESENASLFPEPVAQWAAAHSDELGCLQMEIEETPGLIED